jgi:hypothetical protein
VDDPVAGVRGFLPELELAAGVEVELRAGGVQLGDPCRAFLDQDRDGGRIAEGGARGESILAMQLRRVSGTERRSDAPLGIGGGAVEQRPLRQHHHLVRLRRPPRGMEAGDATADDEKPSADALQSRGSQAWREETESYRGAQWLSIAGRQARSTKPGPPASHPRSVEPGTQPQRAP